MKRTYLGDVGRRILAVAAPSASLGQRQAAAAAAAGTVTEQAIAALRAAGVEPNNDGSYNAVTGSGNVVRVTAP